VSVLSEERTPSPSSTRDFKAPAGDLGTQDSAPREIDLHGLTVDQALGQVDQALNEALLAGAASLRIIHGRSGGRIRNAVHRRLKEIEAIRTFRLDPRNPGVTVVRF
jgi:DNA mismatch repair protein MutS2